MKTKRIRSFSLRVVTLFTVAGMLGLLSVTFIGQTVRTIDLSNQLVPILDEQMKASNYRTLVGDWPGADKSLPLKLTIQSISPVSKVSPRATVQITIQNIGQKDFDVPVSREAKVLHYEGNVDRRKLFCSLVLEPKVEHPLLAGVLTYSSSNEPSSRVRLRSGESLQLAFEANLERIWQEEFAAWEDAISSGALLLAVQCTQETLIALPESSKVSENVQSERIYRSGFSESVRSANAVLLNKRP